MATNATVSAAVFVRAVSDHIESETSRPLTRNEYIAVAIDALMSSKAGRNGLPCVHCIVRTCTGAYHGEASFNPQITIRDIMAYWDGEFCGNGFIREELLELWPEYLEIACEIFG